MKQEKTRYYSLMSIAANDFGKTIKTKPDFLLWDNIKPYIKSIKPNDMLKVSIVFLIVMITLFYSKSNKTCPVPPYDFESVYQLRKQTGYNKLTNRYSVMTATQVATAGIMLINVIKTLMAHKMDLRPQVEGIRLPARRTPNLDLRLK